MKDVVVMDNKKQRRIWLMWINAAMAMVLCLCIGCQQQQARVYKVSYSNPNTNHPVSPNSNYQGPNNFQAAPSSPSFQTPNAWPAGSEAIPQAREYHLGAGDTLKIKINQLLELDHEEVLMVEIDQRGQIYLPLLNHVHAEGLTCEQLRNEIALRLSQEFIRNPQVDVNIEQFGSKKVMVLGMVRNPGPVVLDTDCAPLMNIISQAGGISGVSNGNVEIIRCGYRSQQNGPGQIDPASWSTPNGYNGYQPPLELIPVNYLFAKEGQQVNPLIYPGDVVKIPLSENGYIYVSGEVAQPGAKPFRDPMTILQAVSSAGGASNVADEQKCKVIRRMDNGSEQVIMVNLEEVRKGKQKNLIIARNDTILMPVHPVKKFFDDINQLVRRGVNVGMDVTYDAGYEMGMPTRQGTY